MKAARSTSVTGILLAGVAAGSLVVFSVVAQQTAGNAVFGLGPVPRQPSSAVGAPINLPGAAAGTSESESESGSGSEVLAPQPDAPPVAQLEPPVSGFAPVIPEPVDREVTSARGEKAWRDDDYDADGDDSSDHDWDDETHHGSRGHSWAHGEHGAPRGHAHGHAGAHGTGGSTKHAGASNGSSHSAHQGSPKQASNGGSNQGSNNSASGGHGPKKKSKN